MRCIGVVLLLMVFGRQEAKAQACQQGVFVYLDVSGSMYDSDFNPQVVYLGQRMFLLDAMLKFAGSTFGNTTFLQEGDYFSFNVFAESVQSFGRPQDLSSDDIRNLQGLHEAFDRDDDGAVGLADLGALNLNVNPQRTSFVALLDRIESDVDAFNSQRQQGEAVSVMVFTDARYDATMDAPDAVTARLEAFAEDFRGSLDGGRFTFMFIPLIDTEVTPSIEASLPSALVRPFILSTTADERDLVRAMRAQIRQSRQARVEIIEHFTIRHDEIRSRADWYRFVIPVRNVSCVGGSMAFEIDYEIYSLRKETTVLRWGLERSKEFDAYERDTVNVNLDFSDFDDPAYRVTFRLRDRRTGKVTTGEVPDFSREGGGIPWFVQLVIFVFIAAVVGSIGLWVMSNRKSRFHS